jgi:photosystem II stability/assembly factor-like uncharacterized protein
LPNLNGRQINDITFTDSLTGYAVTNRLSATDTTFILKTTNGGDNWFFAYADSGAIYTQVQFINVNTGFVAGLKRIGSPYYYLKTTNSGANWFYINAPFQVGADDIFALNEDTIWIATSSNPTGGVFFTSNGGANWIQQLSLGSSNPARVYFFDGNLGFASRTTGQVLYRTSNSGMNWTSNSTAGAFTDMYFANSLTGWKTGVAGGPGSLRKTTDSGLNWFDQTMPSGGNIVAPLIEKISGLNKDTIWGAGAQIFTSLGIRGMINRTTDGGNTWLFQVPDSTYNNNTYNYLDFYNKLNGWAYLTVPRGIHTTTGGDPVWYTGIQSITGNIPKDFSLKQNYPNPFNPRTVIPFSLKQSAYVKLIAYEITGREVQKMVNSKLSAGEYEVDFMGKFTASGVYLYRMEVTDDKSKQLYTETKKMILLK